MQPADLVRVVATLTADRPDARLVGPTRFLANDLAARAAAVTYAGRHHLIANTGVDRLRSEKAR